MATATFACCAKILSSADVPIAMAHRAFQGCTKNTIIHHMGPLPKPVHTKHTESLHSVVETAVRHYLPDLDDGAILEILAKRHFLKLSDDDFSTAMTEICIDDKDVEEMTKHETSEAEVKYHASHSSHHYIEDILLE